MAFSRICNTLGVPDIDLFASRVNAKCDKYISWKKDPGSIAVDAFTVKWTEFFYAFPPFSLILKVLRKVEMEGCRGILVVPDWPSQPWYPLCMEMFESTPIKFKPHINLLLSSDRQSHPLWSQLTMVAGILSSRHSP